MHLVEQVNDHGDEFGINDSLHLLLVACCDVGQEPHCLLQEKRNDYKSKITIYVTISLQEILVILLC